MRENSDIMLQVVGLKLMRGNTVLLSNLNFNMQNGDAIWVTGSNGIGKTTLLRAVAGLLRPESGKILWQNMDVFKTTSGDIGFAGHNDSHKPNLTVLETIAFWQIIYNSSQGIDALLTKIGLYKKKNIRAKSLSAGQSRRLALGRLLLQNAKLWILDEPLASMDRKGQILIENLIKEHCKNGNMALIASHTKPQKIGNNTRILHIDRDINE